MSINFTDKTAYIVVSACSSTVTIILSYDVYKVFIYILMRLYSSMSLNIYHVIKPITDCT